MNPRNIKPGKVVRLRWVDSKAHKGWQRDAKYVVGYIASAGIVVACDKAGLTISNSVGSDGWATDPLTLPWGCITSLRIIKC